MTDEPSSLDELQKHLDGMLAGDSAARDELFRRAANRLERLTRKMLQGFPGVHRWAQTDDVLQSALMRLLRALEAVRPKTVRELFGLSTEMIRRELLDLARHYYGPQGLGANYASSDGQSEGAGPAHDRGDLTFEPSALAGWRELHDQVQNLPEPERETFMLLFYQELPQAQAAELLGVSVRQVQRRWQSALLSLHKVLKGQWPGL